MLEYLAIFVLALLLSGTGYMLYSRGGSSKIAASDASYSRVEDASPETALDRVLIFTAAVEDTRRRARLFEPSWSMPVVA